MIEVTPSNNLFSYRQDPDEPKQLQWRYNRAQARWQPWGEPFDDAALAIRALLQLTGSPPGAQAPPGEVGKL